jgi:hypothetical protein
LGLVGVADHVAAERTVIDVARHGDGLRDRHSEELDSRHGVGVVMRCHGEALPASGLSRLRRKCDGGDGKEFVHG